MRDTVVGMFVIDRRDQRCLAIVVPAACDPRPRGDAGSAPVCADQHPSAHDPAIGQGHRNACWSDVLRDDGRSGQMRDPAGPHRRKQGAIKEPVLQHVADQTLFDFGPVEMQEQPARSFARYALSRLDLPDRLRITGKVAPQSQRGQQALRRQRQRIGPPVEGIARAQVRGAGVDHRR